MEKRRNKYWLPIIVFGLFFVISGIYVIKSNNKLDKNGIYSICTIYDIEGARGGVMVKVFFLYKGDTIKKSSVNSSGKVKFDMIGNRYFIKFLPNHLDGLVDYSINNPVPDSIKATPYEGWKKPPIPLKNE